MQKQKQSIVIAFSSLQATEEIEDRETLALMAARSENEGTSDGETYIEKYTRGVLQVENILSLERLRQASDSSIWSRGPEHQPSSQMDQDEFMYQMPSRCIHQRRIT